MMRSDRVTALFGTLAALLLFAGLVGCDFGQKNTPTKGRVQTQVEATRSYQLLIEDVVATLNDLPAYVNLELNPPVVQLDSSRGSLDGKEILAVCGPNPDLPENPSNSNNHLWVPRGNAGFRRNGIRPGDIVRYFAKLDEMAAQMDINAFGYFEMPVAQVIDENRLLVDVGLTFPVDAPTKLQIWRHVDDRMEEIDEAFQLYVRVCVPKLGWEPSADEITLRQVIGRLNQWIRQENRPRDLETVGLLETLPRILRGSKALSSLISPQALAELSFEPYEGRWLQETVWFRDVSRWARGDSIDDLDRATVLFDWAVRNIDLVPEKASDPPHEPWEVLLYGRGTAAERASVFAHLCRQQGFEVVILTESKTGADEKLASKEAAKPVRPTNATKTTGDDLASEEKPLLAALLSKEKLYLFDPALGLPLPGPDGKGVATLAQARADDGVLRQLDLDTNRRYGWSADDLERVEANLVASPLALSERAAILESQLVGNEAFVLSLDASAQSNRIQDSGQIDDVVLWDHPFHVARTKLLLPPGQDPKQVIERVKRHQRTAAVTDFAIFAAMPMLWKARVLHFQGRKETLVDHRFGGLKEMVDDHKEAMRLYRECRPPERILNKIHSPQRRAMLTVGKQHATYWLGLLAFDVGRFDVAKDLLKRGTLEAFPNGIWTRGARYNLARTYEALGENDNAIAIYLEDDESPQRHGNLIRARRLGEGDGDGDGAVE